jgi:alanyl-tRNA synthetase
MTEKSSSEVRRAFLEFFRGKGHEVVPSSPLVLENDPTLMFVNAGMVQFKDVFTGREQRSYRRAASSQKCIRISGKHNDLEAVGPSPRHQTFFEMLGNFSFGDYFKPEAIEFAWEFLTKDLGLPQERMIVTYFKGEHGVPEDGEARDLWKKLTGWGDDRVVGLGMSDNFWQMGDTGPCGPCSEIYLYNGPNVDFGAFGQEQTPEGVGWMEIWNLVFMQFERSLDASGEAKLAALPAPSIDTGAGLERLSSVVGDKLSNYDTDVLRSLVERAAELAGKPYRRSSEPDDVSMRVIADHARTTAFLIAEGLAPDRTGPEYVLRRVMRRAIRHGHRLGIQKPFLHEAALAVVDAMGDHYQNLRERRDLIASVAYAEEERFRQTIERGLGLLEERFDALATDGVTTLDGRDAFRLYDTFGFPLDLTEVICAERGISVDTAGYKAALAEAKERSEFKGQTQAVESVYRDAAARLTEAGVRFLGYERNEASAKLVALIAQGKLVEHAGLGDAVELVFDATPFYAESGGQVGDTGTITGPNGLMIVIEDTHKPIPGLFVHRGRVEGGSISVGDTLELRIDVPARERTRRNHSATHLLHFALRKVLGSHAQQKGSLVGPERLRFDFTHNRPLTREEIHEIETLVNERTLANHPVRTEVLTMEEAKQRGAMMIFEEKYGAVVRLLSMAESTELCGGTHARATGDIGLFKIVSEQGVAAGVRRITAVTGEGALAHLRELEAEIGKAALLVKATPATLTDKLEKLVQRERGLEKQIDELQRKLASGGGGAVDLLAGVRDVSGVKVLGLRTEVTDRGALRELAERLRDQLGDSIVLVGSEAEGKAQLVLTVAKSLTNRYRAGDLIRGIAEIVGGSGGGRPDMAQAGGTDPQRLDEALAAVYTGVANQSGPSTTAQA